MGSKRRRPRKRRQKQGSGPPRPRPAKSLRFAENGDLFPMAPLALGILGAPVAAQAGGFPAAVGVLALSVLVVAVVTLARSWSVIPEPLPAPAPEAPPPRAPPPPPEPPAPPPLPDPSALRPRDRSLAEWLVALRAVGAGAAAGMRAAPLPRDGLLRLAEAEDASPVDRAAAAVALAAGADPDERTRLRVAAGAADRRLRVVLERAAEGADEDDLGEALEALRERG